MKVARHVIEKKRDSVWFARDRRRLHGARPGGEAADQGSARVVCQAAQVGVRQGIRRQILRRDGFRRAAQHGAAPRMRVLHVKHRVIPGLRHGLIEVELHLRVGLAGQHGEADGVAADFLQQIAQGDIGAGAFRHAKGSPPRMMWTI